MDVQKKLIEFPRKLLIVGFGSIAQATLPLILRHIHIKPEQITIITKDSDGKDIAEKYGIQFLQKTLVKENYLAILHEQLAAGDFLLNLSVDISSLDLIIFCQENNVLYLDTCIEPWAGVYTDSKLPIYMRSNYAFREAVLAYKKEHSQGPTAIITHGANPGLVSHFVKQALINIGKDIGLETPIPTTQKEWAELAAQLNIKVIHIAERDTQITNTPKKIGEFVNTWSVDGFVSEGSQPAELGWGSHERHWPDDAVIHSFGCQCAIYLKRPGAATRVRTWTPDAGSFHGFLVTHGESISISDYFTLKNNNAIQYRPTVHYAYHPCEDAVLSMHELAGREWNHQQIYRLILNDIVDGMDELGVLLMGHRKGAYWYGSQLTIHEARKLVPHNNATSLQVAIGTLSAMIWAMEHPNAGITEPDEIDFRFILKIATPYLGKVSGHYTDWTPIKERGKLFPENMDHSDPWQFINIRVS